MQRAVVIALRGVNSCAWREHARRPTAPGRRRVVVQPSQICPWCHDALGTAAVCVCPRCATLYHAACTAELGGCSTFGCPGPQRDAWSEVRPQRLGPAPPLGGLGCTTRGSELDHRAILDDWVAQHERRQDWLLLALVGMVIAAASLSALCDLDRSGVSDLLLGLVAVESVGFLSYAGWGLWQACRGGHEAATLAP